MPMPVDPGGRGTGPGWNPGERLNPVPGDSGGVPIKGGITPIVISGPPLPGDPPPPPSTTTSKVFRPDANEDINTALDACVPLVYGLGIVKAQVYYRMYSNLNEVVDFGVCLGPIDSVVSWWDGIVPAVSDVPPDTDPGYRGTWALTDLGALTKTPYPGTVLGHWEKMANWSQSQEYMINPSLEVKGMLVYDPRLDSTNGGSGSHRLATPSTWEWSDNPALCFADFKMSTRYGAGVASALIDWATVAACADWCDVDVSGEKRFTLNIVLAAARTVQEWEDALGLHFGARWQFSGGLWKIIYRSGSVVGAISLTNDDIVGEPSLSRGAEGVKRVNHVTAEWAAVALPMVPKRTAVAYASVGVSEAMSDPGCYRLGGITSATMAKRALTAILETSSLDMVLSATLMPEFINLTTDDVIELNEVTLAPLGTCFRVETAGRNEDGTVTIRAREVIVPGSVTVVDADPIWVDPGSTGGGSGSGSGSGSGGGTTITDHAALSNLGYAVAGHTGFVPDTRSVIAGSGLSGGGTLASDRTLAVAFGATAGTACEGNDTRLANDRTPVAHAIDGAKHTASGLTTGHFLKASGATTFGFAAHGLGYGDVGALAAGGTAVDSDKLDGQHGSYYAVAGAAPTAHDLLATSHGDTLADAVTAGDIIFGNDTPKWASLAITVPASTFFNVLGVHNAETKPTWKALFDATVPSTQAANDSASAGTATVAARRDHKHTMPATYPATAHNLLDGSVHGDTLADTVTDGDMVIGNATPKWSSLAISVPASTFVNFLGVANGETRPSWKAMFDATVPGTIAVSATAAAGTAVAAARRDHTHGAPATWTPTAHAFIDTTGHSASGLTTGHFLKATGATTYAFGAHGISHTTLGDIGTNTHANIDTHIGNTGESVHGLGDMSLQHASAITASLIPNATDTYDLGSATKLWNQSYISQINAVIFSLNTQTLFGGYSTIAYAAGTFAADTGTGTTVDFGQAMTNGHFVCVRATDKAAAVTVEFMQVGSNVSGTTYNVTRNLSGVGAKDFAAGTPFLVLGTTGTGRIDMYAYDGKARLMVNEQGAAYGTVTERVRLGHLEGWGGYSAGVYGLAVGTSTASYLTFDPTNGVILGYNGTPKIQLKANGDAEFTGTVKAGSAAGGWTIDATAITASSGVVGLSSAVTGGDDIRIWAGHATPASAPFIVTEAGALTASSGSVGGWTLAAGRLYGTGVNLWSGASAGLAFGATPPASASSGTGIWLDATGLYGLASNVVQAKMDAATGKITAGAGNVSLDVDGINITSGTTGWASPNSIDFMSGATLMGSVYSTYSSAVRTLWVGQAAEDALPSHVAMYSRASTGSISTATFGAYGRTSVNASLQAVVPASVMDFPTLTLSTTEGTGKVEVWHDTVKVSGAVGIGYTPISGEDLRIASTGAALPLICLSTSAGASTTYLGHASTLFTSGGTTDLGIRASGELWLGAGGSTTPVVKITAAGAVTVGGTAVVLGSGTSGKIAKWGASTLGDSVIVESSGKIGTNAGAFTPSLDLSIYTATTGGVNIVYAGDGIEGARFSANFDTGEVRIGGTRANFFPTFYSANTERMRITSSGAVGIGCSPGATAKVEVQSSGAESSLILRNASQSNASYSEILLAPFTGVTAAASFIRNVFRTDNRSCITFGVTGTAAPPAEVMRIENSGYVGIGCTAPATNLQVAADKANSSNYGQIEAIGATSASKRMTMGFDTTGDVGWLQASITGTGYKSLLLSPNGGGVAVGGTSVTSGRTLDVTGDIRSSTCYHVGANQVVGARQAAIGDLSGYEGEASIIVNLAETLNSVLAKLRTHGLIAT